jgi:hypothetical protein
MIGAGFSYISTTPISLDPLPRSSKGAKAEAGQDMAEFGLSLPTLMLLMLGIIEFGRLLFTYSAVTTAARIAARYGSAAGGLDAQINNYQDCDGIRGAAARIGGLPGVENSAAGVAIA